MLSTILNGTYIMSQAGDDSSNLTKLRSNIISMKFPREMAISEQYKIFHVFFAFKRSEYIGIIICYI